MYNYLKAMKSDIKDYIKNEVNTSNYSDREELENDLNDILWNEDSVTVTQAEATHLTMLKLSDMLMIIWICLLKLVKNCALLMK